jgi:hypothetical protein
MCFFTEDKIDAKFAKEDIQCWKIVTRNGWNSFSGATGVRYKYIKGTQPNVSLRLLRMESGFCINEGYHSYISLKIAKAELKHCKEPIDRYKKFIIPKGTRYYKNETEYVSETIMLVE